VPWKPSPLFGGRGKAASRKFRYAPSLAAVGQSIIKKGKVPKPATKFTGFELRPIIVPKGKKRRPKDEYLLHSL
jgi:hypothetical protein